MQQLLATVRPHRAPRGLTLCAALALGVALAPRPANAEPRDDARRHFLAGLEAANTKNFQLALDEFLAAQAAYPHPNMLYNIARAYTDLEQFEQAIEYYRLYQAAAPDKAADVDPIIAVLEARLKRTTAAAPSSKPSDVGAAATSAEMERLAAIADELAQLSRAMADRGAAAAAAEADTATEPTDASDAVATDDPAIPPTGEFLSDAYEQVVVTASRYGQSPLDSPSTVTILSDEDIRMSGATNVPDLLRRVAGVEVMQLAASQPDVSVRGFNRELSNKVLVLIDGRSVYLDILGTVFWGTLPISLQEIQRIEIIRGPGSAIYGANAVTGVINIITKTPGVGENLVHFEGGRPGYGQGTAIATGQQGKNAYRFSAGYHQTGRWSAEARVDEDSPVRPIIDDQNLALQAVRANGRIDRRFLDKGVASVSGGYAQGYTEFYVFGALGDYALPFKSGYARADLSYGPVHLRSFYNKTDAQSGPWIEYKKDKTDFTNVDSDTFDVELEAHQRFETGPVQHTLNAGLGFRYKGIQWGYLEGGGDLITEQHYSAFVQEDARVGRFALVGALRADRHPLVDIQHTLSPRGAAILRVADRTAVRLTGGTSFRAPTQMENYLDFNQGTGTDGALVRTRGDRNLLPERILTVEAGVHDETFDWARADAAVYYNRVQDLIFVQDITAEISAYDPDANAYIVGTTTFGNLDPVYTGIGGEAELRVFPVDGVDVYANANVQRTEQETSEGVSTDGSTSAIKLNVGTMVRTPWRIDLSGDVHYVSEQTWLLREYNAEGLLIPTEASIPARTIGSARVGARPFKDDSLEVAAAVWNIGALLGDPFREHPKGQLVDARITGSATYRF